MYKPQDKSGCGIPCRRIQLRPPLVLNRGANLICYSLKPEIQKQLFSASEYFMCVLIESELSRLKERLSFRKSRQGQIGQTCAPGGNSKHTHFMQPRDLHLYLPLSTLSNPLPLQTLFNPRAWTQNNLKFTASNSIRPSQLLEYFF